MERKIHLKSVIISAIILIVIILLAIFLIRTISNFIIINNLSNLANKYLESTNYYIRISSYNSEVLGVYELYNKDQKQLSVWNAYGKSIQETRQIIQYYNQKPELILIKSGDNKVAFIPEETFQKSNHLYVNLLANMDIGQQILMAIVSNINTEAENYIIEVSKEWKVWIDKETGLTKREVNSGIVSDKVYEFNQVTDENVAKPDMTGYTIQENN